MVRFGRTDLASEARQRAAAGAADSSLPGVRAREYRLSGLPVTEVEVLDRQGAQALGKPEGLYFTLTLEGRFERGAEAFPRAAEALARLIGRCAPLEKESCVLIAALGNPDITPDALGSLAASNILVTRHLKRSDPETFSSFRPTALCRTGVLGTTGMESALQIRTLCRELRPDLVLAIDALAGAELDRLCRCVQICSTGISPGSGVGNDRQALNRETLGVPVVAIGVPTVVDAAGLSNEPGLAAMFVTPRDIDSAVRTAGRLIGYGVNLALHEDLTVEDIDMLIG